MNNISELIKGCMLIVALFSIGCATQKRVVYFESDFSRNVIIIYTDYSTQEKNRDTLFSVLNHDNIFLYNGKRFDYVNTYFYFNKSTEEVKYAFPDLCNDSSRYSLKHIENGYSEKPNKPKISFNILFFRKCNEKINIDSAHKALDAYLDSL